MPERLACIHTWLQGILGSNAYALEPASRDASFRRYFRVQASDGSYILMDAPPQREDCRPFVGVAQVLAGIGVHVPEILSADVEQGLILLEDLGTEHYLDKLDAGNVDRLYGDACGALLSIQACAPTQGMADYNRSLLQAEMNLFADWFLLTHLRIQLTEDEHRRLTDIVDLLCRSALEQPQVFVHRDYHSRNLMVDLHHNPGILDFQDAVRGPVTYDLVSLLRDVYVRWPVDAVVTWVGSYHDLALQHGILEEVDLATFLRWFDLMGVQRHLKVAGIFARLYYCDGKPRYLKDILLTLDYLVECAARYPELAPLKELFDGWALRERLAVRNAAVLDGAG